MAYVDNAQLELQQMMSKVRQGFLSNMESAHKGEHFVLSALYFSDEKQLTPKEIGKSTRLTSPRISSILASLEKKQEIIRTTDPKNRRQVFVTLTPTGVERVENFKSEINNKFRYVFEKMGEEKTENFISLLKEFVALQAEYNRKD